MTSDTQKRRAAVAVPTADDARPAHLHTTRELAVAHSLSAAFFAEGERLEAQLLAARDDSDPLDPWPGAGSAVALARWPLVLALGLGLGVAAACLWLARGG
jgi:hypothetical protein